MDTMKALQIVAPQEARVVELPIPQPGEDQVLLRVTAVNTCPQWDLHIYFGRPMFDPSESVPFPYPRGQPGHEATGIVHSVGPGVSQFQAGDRVSVWRDQGQSRPGCYAQYAIFEEANLLQVPEHLDPDQVVSMELAMCVSATILDLKRAGAIGDKMLGISGRGSAGLVAAQLARAEGAAEVVGFDISESRRENALSLGLDRAIDPRSEEGQRLARRDSVKSLDVSIDCVGGKESVQYLMDHTREIVALFGVQREDYIFRHPRLKLFGYPGHYREAAEYALDRILDGKLDLRPLATYRMKLEDYARAIDLLRSQAALKVCFLPWNDG